MVFAQRPLQHTVLFKTITAELFSINSKNVCGNNSMSCNPSSVRVGETFGGLVPNVTGAHGLGYARKKIALVTKGSLR